MMLTTGLLLTAHLLIQGGVIIRILLRPHRQPASRIAWIAVVAALPLAGAIAYLALGETNIGRRNLKSMGRAVDGLSAAGIAANSSRTSDTEQIPQKYAHLFNVGHSISGFLPATGNRATLLADSNASIDHMVADIDTASRQVNLLFYIWLTDNNGQKIAAALQRAALRGVTCRAMVDGLGSRALLRSDLWQDMKNSGVRTAVALPPGNRLLRPLQGRVDLRNHRKILVIDGHTTYCGSQNCADPEFRVKAKYAPWVDSVVRFEGPVAAQNQLLFATDWMAYTGEQLDGADLEKALPVEKGNGKTVAQVVASGPTLRHSAMPEMFASLIYSAREELTISTPYYVPNEPMQAALCAAAYRGVHTTLILPCRNDSWEVAATSRSYYADLLQAGVNIQEYVGGLLHSKTLTLDGDITLIGSANMDRRSFDLNYENNILCYDPALTHTIRQRQQSYIDSAEPVTLAMVQQWSKLSQLWNNAVGMMGPVL
jgi:cardiolipin synthase